VIFRASGSISGRSGSMKRVQIRSATKMYKPNFNGVTNGNMVILENEEQ